MNRRSKRRKLRLEGLAERGFTTEQLSEMAKVIDAEKSDVFDVLAYIAFTIPPITRAERVTQHRTEILSHYDPNLQSFIDFVLSQYITQGVTELDENKLSDLLALRYHTLYDATATLGAVPPIRAAFTSFQPRLFRAQTASHPA